MTRHSTLLLAGDSQRPQHHAKLQTIEITTVNNSACVVPKMGINICRPILSFILIREMAPLKIGTSVSPIYIDISVSCTSCHLEMTQNNADQYGKRNRHQLSISTIRIADIANYLLISTMHYRYQQLELLISPIDCWYQQFELLISTMRIVNINNSNYCVH